VFRNYVLDFSQPIPAGVSQIQVYEQIVLGYNGPAVLRFKITESALEAIVETDNTATYQAVECQKFEQVVLDDPLISNNLNKLIWWRPKEVLLPRCYRSTDGVKHLLADLKVGEVYFYRAGVCGLCPD
jgi:hypothetical protein